MKKITIVFCLFLCLQLMIFPVVTVYAAATPLTKAEGKIIQQKLKDLGYYTGKVDGKFSSSYKAINALFEDKGLTYSNGKVRTVSSGTTWSDLNTNFYNTVLNTEEKGLTPIERTGSPITFIEAVKKCKAYTAAHGFKYCFCSNFARINLSKSERHSCSKHGITSSDPKYVTNCSEGVTASLLEYAKSYATHNPKGSEKLINICKETLISSYKYNEYASKITKKNNFFISVGSDIKDAKKGDILISYGHVEVYAGRENGKIMVWNWGNNSAISTPERTVSNVSSGEILNILRVKPLDIASIY